ncbi:MAG: hypothetical protein GY874_01020 [Desulfobacteraceae bacterium]|nr:hypothetical protein [Desulfobacteraceae bacterium]
MISITKRLIVILALIFFLTACVGGKKSDSSGTDTPDTQNRAPSADAGTDRQITLGNDVTLDGSNSSDSDGDSLSYDWRFATIPDGSSAQISNSTTSKPDFTPDLTGEYIIELTVDDGADTASDSVIITVVQIVVDCDYLGSDASDEDRFLCAHNEVRNSAQPVPDPALEPMTWDEDLAEIAQDYAEKCIWDHNPDRSENYLGYVGENLYMTTSKNSTSATAVQSWGAEIAYYDYDTNDCESGKTCGHYTQIVWRDTIKVGCGIAFCSSVAQSPFVNAYLYVCNYSPGGNYTGKWPY